MGGFKNSYWPKVLVLMLLLQLQSVEVQAADPALLKLRRLNEQFHQFQISTKARLNMLALNQDRNSSRGLENRVKALNDRCHQVSRDLEHLKHSTAEEIDGLRDWNRKLEKKNKQMDVRLALLERNLRENCRYRRKPMPDSGKDFSNLTLKLRSQEERLTVLQAQRDELLLGLKGLQESLKSQALRVTQLESQLSEVFQENGRAKMSLGASRGMVNSNVTPQEYYKPHKRSQTHRGERILDRRTQTQTDSHSVTQPENKLIIEPGSHPRQRVQYLNPKPDPDLSHPKSRIQSPELTRSPPVQQEHLQASRKVNYHQEPIKPQLQHGSHSQIKNQDRKHPSWTQTMSHHSSQLKSKNDMQNQTRLAAPEAQHHMHSKTDTKLESSVVRNFLQIPMRHKIPAQAIPRKDRTICNLDSMLLFPSASAENYVTFSSSLPDLPELSLCLWIRVAGAHVGTLLSYATEDNDNQLVLYGRSSSASSTPLSLSSSTSLYSPSPSFSFSSPAMDFVIGDPIYRRLPASLLLDAHWHHLCVLWSSIQGRFWHYVDRSLVSSGSNFRRGWEIPGGGSVVLGQEQDSVGGGFDAAEGFAGQMAGFRVWNRVLSALEVEGVADGKGVPRGMVLGMEDIKEVHGEVQQVACECLEHCI